MSIVQKDEIEQVGQNLCLKKTLYELHKKSLVTSEDFIKQNQKLDFSFCGPNPERVGRGEQCSRAKLENEARIAKHNEKMLEVNVEEKKIKKLESEYEKLKNAKALPNRKIDQAAERKRKASNAIAKVKQDILDSMKDPDSTKFRNITTSEDGSFVCGEVNSKNSMGGYMGFKKFANIDDGLNNFYFYEEKDDRTIMASCEKQAKT